MEKTDPDFLNNLRHSAAHLLAAAVVELYPGAKPTIGPVIENGFYYDFDLPQPISEEDLPRIEAKMAEIVKGWDIIEGREVSVEEARKIFTGNPYKLELIEELEKSGRSISIYTSGNFEDLCRGGHVASVQEIKTFKLLSVAGAYWRGSEKNKMLTRIYGTAFPTKEELAKYLLDREQALAHDHRKIGKDLELFAISEEVGPGLILWLPKGTIIKEELEKLGKETENQEGYKRISTPHITREALYYMSGHLPYYADDMYPPMIAEDGTYYLKPMNCPHTHMVYKALRHTYKEFPIRYAEFGTVYRYEKSGELLGMLRVRGFTQNDAHIYVTEEDVLEEMVKVMELHTRYYKIFGLKDYYVELALPDLEKKKDKYFDNPKAWEKSVALLREAAKKVNIEVVEKVGGAAFYGPKFDFNIKSVTGREFGASTNQLDFGSGERFKMTYIDRDGSEKIVPYVIHRAPLGADERFIGFLIEHYGGAFPTWLSPTQVMIVPITDRNLKYGQNVLEQLKSAQIRAEMDERAEKMQAKIRDAQLQKIPYMLIIGDREEKEGKVAVRTREGKDLGAIDLSAFIDTITKEIVLRQAQHNGE